MLTETLLRTLAGTFLGIKWYFTGVAAFLIAERIFPVEKNQPFKNVLFSSLLSLIYLASAPFVVALPMHYVVEPLVKLFGGPFFAINLDAFPKNGHISWVARNLMLPFVPILAADFFYYWFHRLQHTLPALWAQHKLHHSEASLCAATTNRHHWTEDGLRAFIIVLPMSLLISLTGVNGAVIAPALAYWAFFIHSNIRLPLGPIAMVFCGPQAHRIHHSIEEKHFNKNYAAFFPIWDIVFGTYYHPQKMEWPKTGIAGESPVNSLWQALILPFERWKPYILARNFFAQAGGFK